MKLIKYYLFLLAIILSSCSTSFESFEDKVSISATSSHIIINNQLSEEIYYFVVEQQILAVIDWAPSTSGPVIKSIESLKIPFNDIYNGKQEPVKSGDKIVVYWWTNTIQDFNGVHSEVIAI